MNFATIILRSSWNEVNLTFFKEGLHKQEHETQRENKIKIIKRKY